MGVKLHWTKYARIAVLLRFRSPDFFIVQFRSHCIQFVVKGGNVITFCCNNSQISLNKLLKWIALIYFLKQYNLKFAGKCLLNFMRIYFLSLRESKSCLIVSKTTKARRKICSSRSVDLGQIPLHLAQVSSRIPPKNKYCQKPSCFSRQILSSRVSRLIPIRVIFFFHSFLPPFVPAFLSFLNVNFSL